MTELSVSALFVSMVLVKFCLFCHISFVLFLQLIKILLENGSCRLHVHYSVFVFTVGSQFRNPGLFEVTKATNSEDKIEQFSTNNRALEVTVGSDLEGTADVRVAIVMSGEQLETASVRGKNLVPQPRGWGDFDTNATGLIIISSC